MNILVASDLSIRSDRAVLRAIKLASMMKAHLTVVHVVDAAIPLRLAETIKLEAEKSLTHFVTSNAPSSDLKYDVEIAVGDPVSDIQATAIKTNADLLIVGIHRERAFLDLIKETTMERLIRTTTLPTLLVCEPADKPYSRLVSAIDMSPASAAAIRVALKLAPSASHDLFHAFHVPYPGFTNPKNTTAGALPFRKEAEQAYEDWRADAELPDTVPAPTFIEGSVSLALGRMIGTSKPDLLALGAHSRTNLGRYILGSFAANLIRQPPCDLLLAR